MDEGKYAAYGAIEFGDKLNQCQKSGHGKVETDQEQPISGGIRNHGYILRRARRIAA